MKSKKLYLLVSVMLVSIALLIGVQLNWIHTAVNFGNKQLAQLVNQSLIEVSKDLETNETVYQISNEIYSYNEKEINFDSPIFKNPKLYNDSSDMLFVKQSSFIKDKDGIKRDTSYKVYKNDSLVVDESKHYSNAYEEEVKSEDLEKHINQTIGDKSLFVERIVNRLLDYNDDITKRVKRCDVNKLLQKYFLEKGIDAKFSFAVKDGTNEYVIWSDNFNENDKKKIYSVRLFPNDIFL